MCGKRLTCLYTSPYKHVQYNPRLSTFVFERLSEKKDIQDYIRG